MAALNVLIVDDELCVRRLLARILQRELQLAPSEAASGRQACELAAQSAFDAIICDLYLPDIDGVKVIKKLQKAGRCPPLIIMLSGAIPPPAETMPAGTVFISKPFHPGDIIAPLADYAARQQRPAPPGQTKWSMPHVGRE